MRLTFRLRVTPCGVLRNAFNNEGVSRKQVVLRKTLTVWIHCVIASVSAIGVCWEQMALHVSRGGDRL